MSTNAIEVSNLSKRYRIGFEKQARDTFAEVISDWITQPIRNFRKLRNLTQFEQDNQEDTNILQKHSNTGRPLGGIKFIEKIEKLF